RRAGHDREARGRARRCGVTTTATTMPATLTINAWTGAPTPAADLLPGAERWGSGGLLPLPQNPLFDEPADPLEWADDAVGYGVLLLDGSPQADGAAKAA